MKADRYIICLFLQSLILLWGWHAYFLFIHTISDFTMKADSYTICLFLQSDFTTKADRCILYLFLQSLILLWKLTCIFFVNSCNLWFYYKADTYILCLFLQSQILLWRLTGIFSVFSSKLWFYYEGWQVYSLFTPAIHHLTKKVRQAYFLFRPTIPEHIRHAYRFVDSANSVLTGRLVAYI
jgi:hypothetical protein